MSAIETRHKMHSTVFYRKAGTDKSQAPQLCGWTSTPALAYDDDNGKTSAFDFIFVWLFVCVALCIFLTACKGLFLSKVLHLPDTLTSCIFQKFQP